MCRSIKTLRPPFTDAVSPADVEAAALQYVRKVAGMRAPSARNAAAFEAAVQEVAAATSRLLERVEVRPAQPRRVDARPVETSAGPERGA